MEAPLEPLMGAATWMGAAVHFFTPLKIHVRRIFPSAVPGAAPFQQLVTTLANSICKNRTGSSKLTSCSFKWLQNSVIANNKSRNMKNFLYLKFHLSDFYFVFIYENIWFKCCNGPFSKTAKCLFTF